MRGDFNNFINVFTDDYLIARTLQELAELFFRSAGSSSATKIVSIPRCAGAAAVATTDSGVSTTFDR